MRPSGVQNSRFLHPAFPFDFAQGLAPVGMTELWVGCWLYKVLPLSGLTQTRSAADRPRETLPAPVVRVRVLS
jgi:hypothetical protein